MDISHFVIDLDDGKTCDFRGAHQVKYRSVVSGREGNTMKLGAGDRAGLS
ncbi:hypothetical protein GQ600_21662 [Phytophthora cactorum]|nr:hypothetical protein GQ600_21662 [Phytophthora cactorum]